ncbi:hypothetical protein DL95DRAFT_395076, partial [Leptodontidium sp. 2 PMI_412]
MQDRCSAFAGLAHFKCDDAFNWRFLVSIFASIFTLLSLNFGLLVFALLFALFVLFSSFNPSTIRARDTLIPNITSLLPACFRLDCSTSLSSVSLLLLPALPPSTAVVVKHPLLSSLSPFS